MELDEAYERALEDTRVKEIMSKGFYLSSAFIDQDNADAVEKWNLIFFNPKSGNVVSVSVAEDGVEISDVQKPLKEGFYEEMSTKGKGDIEDILKIIRKEFPTEIAKLLVSIRGDSWDILVIGRNLKTLFMKIDVGTKEIVKKEKGSLIRKA